MSRRIMLTLEEQEEIKSLKKNFNKVPEADVYDYKASRRVDISRKGSLIFLMGSIFLNILTVVMILFSITVFMLKPSPNYYATHPSGSVYGPLPKFK